jgi:hypothetical protein
MSSIPGDEKPETATAGGQIFLGLSHRQKKHIRRSLAAFPRLKASLLVVEADKEKLAWLSHREMLFLERLKFGKEIPAGTLVGTERLRLYDTNYHGWY